MYGVCGVCLVCILCVVFGEEDMAFKWRVWGVYTMCSVC